MHIKPFAKKQIRHHLPRVWNAWRDYRRSPSVEIELSYLDPVVAPDTTAFDIGANRGLYARQLAKLCAKVHAFEPTTAMAEVLRGSMPANVVIHQFALSDRAGVAEIHIPLAREEELFGLASLENSAARPCLTEIVRLCRLDDLGVGSVQFVKIDVEGHETKVLRGAVDTIQRHRPVFLIEAEDRHRPGATAELFAFFDREDYAGWYVHNRQFVPVGSFDLLALQNPDALMVDGGRKPGMAYINNFWFFPQESSAAIIAKFAAR